MIKKLRAIFLPALCLFFSIDTFAEREVLETGSDLPFLSGETLHYKLSYRGLLTSMIWADIADATMTFLANRQTPDEQMGHQFAMQLSTENYIKAEIIQPVRYSYTTTLDTNLQRTLLVEEMDTGKNQSHDFLWLDWHNKETQLFKKREKEQVNSGFWGLESRGVWEKDGELALPEFLQGFPLLENHQTYLIHKESGNKIIYSQVLDPLSLIYFLRTQDFPTIKEVSIAIADDIRQYRIEQTGLEDLKVGGEKYQAIRYKIHSNEKKQNSFYIWLNNDQKKIPLRMSMKAPLGRLEIDLVKIKQRNEPSEPSVQRSAKAAKLE